MVNQQVDTVAGVLVRNGRFLVEKRRDDDMSDPGHIALPGGHVNNGESFEQALRREMKEELGITVLETAQILTGTHIASDGEEQRVHYFHIQRWKGRIASREAARLYWETRPDSLIASDKTAIERVLRTI